ncbi:RNA polymerase sigma factor [Cutibacterium acnes]|uniref:RNA polymerase sigma factor n=1 Tax=Cutibacterium acnes TaxID=1747 RepID=UPI0003120317|nr:hypothetical protein [Cutibacterium acnes]MCY0870784.1 hypothetical protein [Bacillota bacterium]PGF24168.1 hypothetical protein B1B08_12610 [Cutibacterium acnes subsp. defendens]TLG53189.1 hypothetical protein FD538_12290 [Cutibacterium acnes]TMT70235.1 hypothetical protein DMX85_12335 [Cutibacterium acnes]
MFTTTATLNDEWDQIRTIEIDWHDCAELMHCIDVEDVLAVIPAAPDAILGYLIARAQGGDELATRTVIQAFVGKLILMATATKLRRTNNGFDDLLAGLWETIITYPLDRRPDKIAANLVLDTLHRVVKFWRADSPDEEDAHGLVPFPDTLIAPEPDEDVTASQAIALAADRHWITEDLARLMRHIYCDGMTGVDAARLHGCAPATVRSRCRDGRAALQRNAEEILAVC